MSRWRWPTLMAVVVGAAVGVFLLRSESAVVPEGSLRVMTFNIAGRMSDQKRILELLQAEQPDLLLLQEIRYQQQLRWLAAHLQLDYWRFATYVNRHGAGIGILSRWPLGPEKVWRFREGQQGRLALAAVVETPQGPVWACSVHLESPRPYEFGSGILTQGAFIWRELFASTSRDRQVRELGAWLDQLPAGTWIVGGDFNTVPFSRVDRYLSRRFNDVMSRHPLQYFTGTYWKVSALHLNPRIDFLYHSANVHVLDARIIRQKVSDHFPILSLFAPPAGINGQTTDLHAGRR